MPRDKPSDEALVTALRAEFAASGFDIVATFPVGAYNQHEKIAPKPELHLPAAKEHSTLAMIVGNTSALWEPFIRHLKSSAEGLALLKHDDPLDEYTKVVCARALAQVTHEEAHTVYAFETPETTGRCCSVHTAGHVAQLAYYDAEHTQRSVHPKFGPWFAYRAVITFPERRWSAALPTNVKEPLRCPCTDAELKEVAAAQVAVLGKWGTVSEQESWEGLLRVTKTFQVGAEHRYSEPQMKFHYGADVGTRRKVLLDCTA